MSQHSSPSDPVIGSVLARFSKAIGAALGGLTPAVVIGVLSVAGVHVDPSLAAAVCTILGAAGAWIAPANTPKAADPVTNYAAGGVIAPVVAPEPPAGGLPDAVAPPK